MTPAHPSPDRHHSVERRLALTDELDRLMAEEDEGSFGVFPLWAQFLLIFLVFELWSVAPTLGAVAGVSVVALNLRQPFRRSLRIRELRRELEAQDGDADLTNSPG
jgi:hypothetical protein